MEEFNSAAKLTADTAVRPNRMMENTHLFMVEISLVPIACRRQLFCFTLVGSYSQALQLNLIMERTTLIQNKLEERNTRKSL